MRARRPPPKWAAAVFLALSVNAVGLPQRQGILNGELLGEQLPELGGLLLSLGLEGLHPPGQAGTENPPSGPGTVMRSTAYWGLRV